LEREGIMRTGYKSHRRTSNLRYFVFSSLVFTIAFLATLLTLSLSSVALASTPVAEGHQRQAPLFQVSNDPDALADSVEPYRRVAVSRKLTCSTPANVRSMESKISSPCGCRPYSIACPLAIDAPAAGARTLPGRHLNPEGDV
jgi:hypothetical protein